MAFRVARRENELVGSKGPDISALYHELRGIKNEGDQKAPYSDFSDEAKG